MLSPAGDSLGETIDETDFDLAAGDLNGTLDGDGVRPTVRDDDDPVYAEEWSPAALALR